MIAMSDMTKKGSLEFKSTSLGRQRSLNKDHTLTREEREFLRLVREGDAKMCRYLLENHSDRVSVNCSDLTGQTALEIAIGLHDETLVEELLTLDGISIPHIYGAILRAVQENQLTILSTLLEVYERVTDEGKPDKWNLPEFGMTPIMVAASEGNVEITKFLLDKGHLIEKPHHPRCQCEAKCKNKPLEGETLFESLTRISAYKGLASPTYIMLANSDPFLAAFRLSKELQWLAEFFPSHKRQYQELADQCSQFAADLLEQCRDTNEVKTILVQKKGFHDPRPRQFSRLQLAVHYGQKKFVVHPSCQQVLGAAWVTGLPEWWHWSRKRRVLHTIIHAILTPFAALAYILFPSSFIITPVRVPLNRFIYSMTSYIIFLALLLATVVDDTSREIQNTRQKIIEVTVGVFVLGHIFELLMDMYLLGLDTFMKSWWLVYDLVMFTGFLVAEILFFLVVILDIWSFVSNPRTRAFWPWYHPFLIAEGIFALCTILAYARLMLWYQIHSKLGPLGTSLRYMLGDVFRFFLIVCVFLFAFSLGINSVYKNYRNSIKILLNGTIKSQPTEFVSLPSTFKTLFWAGLGMASPDVAAVVVRGQDNMGHEFTEFLGYAMWALYHVVTVIILLNMLIAMMADSYVRVQRNADDEWKFARSSVLLSFFDKQTTLPPPFNMIPSLYGCVWLFKSLKQFALSRDKRDWAFKSRCCYWESDADRQKQENYEMLYQDLISNLIRRYIQEKESDLRRQNGQIISSTAVQRLRSQIFTDIRKSTKK